MTNNQPSLTEQEMLTDALSSQKMMTDVYNTGANECANPALKADFMNILNEEHQIQHEIFSEMQKRGWYQTEQAPQDKVNQAKQKFLSQKS